MKTWGAVVGLRLIDGRVVLYEWGVVGWGGMESVGVRCDDTVHVFVHTLTMFLSLATLMRVLRCCYYGIQGWGGVGRNVNVHGSVRTHEILTCFSIHLQ